MSNIGTLISVSSRATGNLNKSRWWYKGIEIGNTVYKISMMADYTTLILNNIELISNAINTFHKFEKCSGLKLYRNKIEIKIHK